MKAGAEPDTEAEVLQVQAAAELQAVQLQAEQLRAGLQAVQELAEVLLLALQVQAVRVPAEPAAVLLQV